MMSTSICSLTLLVVSIVLILIFMYVSNSVVNTEKKEIETFLTVPKSESNESRCLRKKIISTNNSVKCLDGSTPIYYHQKGYGSGINKWHIHFQGGGWCYNMKDCLYRRQSILGSSMREYATPKGTIENKNESSCGNDAHMNSMHKLHYTSNDQKYNPLMYNWNIILVVYCDGGSFASNAEIKYRNMTFYFHGLNIRRQLITNLLYDENMKNAHEIVLSGCSAGALAIYLGIDEMTSMIKANTPGRNVIIRGLADSGYFMHYNRPSGIEHESDKSLKLWGLGKTLKEWNKAMQQVRQFMNISEGMNSRCREYTALVNMSSSRCLFPQFGGSFVTTPTFHRQVSQMCTVCVHSIYICLCLHILITHNVCMCLLHTIPTYPYLPTYIPTHIYI